MYKEVTNRTYSRLNALYRDSMGPDDATNGLNQLIKDLDKEVDDIAHLILEMNDPRMAATQVKGLSKRIQEWLIRTGYMPNDDTEGDEEGLARPN